MKNLIKNRSISFVSDSFNVEPWALRFNDEEINYFWRPADLPKLGTAVCFPLMGGLPDNKYMLDGKEYTMDTHGFAQDREFAIAEKDGEHICYDLTDDAGTYQQYPWHFRFSLTYAVEGETLKTSYRVENRDEKELYFSVGGHPRYACPITPGTSFEDYFIEFEKPESVKNIVKAYVPLSEIAARMSADGRRLDMDYRLFAQGCFCFHPCHSGEICLRNKKDGRGLHIQLRGAAKAVRGASHLQVWTQSGAPFLAIEPIFGSTSALPFKPEDSDWKGRPGTLHIKSGETFTCAYEVTPLR
ncbi:MAG: hypothetical protein LBT39_06350 [Treponema sp.]|nr:hypothetical protein [Treponema sp.]